jgi:predicted aldo/keto reductase-like oxidoreductase
MIYKSLCGERVSMLGMGNMRLPTAGGPMGAIDRARSRDIIDYVYASGVNYFDTAYVYHQGDSERFLGEVLKKYPRGSYFLATKMPGFMIAPGQTPRGIFEEQLRRCQTDYFDFYLAHNVSESSLPVYMNEELGIIRYLMEEKKNGRIRHLGFSSHGTPATLKSFIERWNCFDFVQIQLNYLDWTLQDAKRQYEIITEHGLPVVVMEPCRGGRLASLNPEADEALKKARPDKSVASWAFRYLQGLDNVRVILSGMTLMEQAADNVSTFSQLEPLSEAEMKALDRALELLKGKDFIPCTKCRYCEGCPQDLDIPELLALYNEMNVAPDMGVMLASSARNPEKEPDSCVSCGLCVSKCPQNINIPDYMSKFAKKIAEMPRGMLPRP